MTASTRAPAIATPAAAWVWVSILAGLCLQLAIAPHIGLPLTAFALLVGVVVVLVLASGELERDVVYVSLIGALLGGLLERFLIGAHAWWHGALSGCVVGALLGDEIQLSGRWMRLARHAKEEARWWQKLPRESRWLSRAVWVLFALVIIAVLSLAVTLEPHLRAQAGLLGEWFEVFRTRRSEASIWTNMAHAWPALAMLAVSVALSRFVSRVPRQALLLEGLMRRIAVLQCAALLLLALDGTLRSIQQLSLLSLSIESLPGSPVEPLIDTLRFSLLPLGVLMLAQIFLGRRLFLYWRRSGWIAAVGMSALVGVLALQFCVAFLMSLKIT